MLPGVYTATKKDGTQYYRSSITFHSKHISLGSYSTEELANQAYKEADHILSSSKYTLASYNKKQILPFEKVVSLVNFRDNKLYINNPIYLRKGYFSYYFSKHEEYKFDIDDLFYYSSHKILRRNGHLFVNDYGMQVTILNRYGIKSYAVRDRDYKFANGDCCDFRYANIIVINPYVGVSEVTKAGVTKYITRIHINGNYKIGTYISEIKAAIAYNKAVDLARDYGINRNFSENYIEDISAKEYADIYTRIKISPKYITYLKELPQN